MPDAAPLAATTGAGRLDTTAAAIRKMVGAIDEFVVQGIKTTLPMQRELILDPAFVEVTHHTRYVDGWLAARRGR